MPERPLFYLYDIWFNGNDEFVPGTYGLWKATSFQEACDSMVEVHGYAKYYDRDLLMLFGCRLIDGYNDSSNCVGRTFHARGKPKLPG